MTARHAVPTLALLAWCLATGLALLFPAPALAQDDLVDPAVREAMLRLGNARVIVEFRTLRPHVAEGRLPGAAAVLAQRRDIASARAAVLGRLARTSHRVRHAYATLPALALEVGPDGLAELAAARLDVVRVHLDRPARPFLAQSAVIVEATQAWAAALDGTGFAIAVLDTGIQSAHPFLAGKVVAGACFTDDACPGGASTQPGDGEPCGFDALECAHGTHVAGVAAGRGATFSGVARGASLISVRIASRSDDFLVCGGAPPCAVFFDSDQIAALEHVFDLRTTFDIAAVNMSLGGEGFPRPCDTDPLKPAVDQLRSVGIATIAASGNEGLNAELGTPACISTVVSVGAVSKAGAVASFSNSAGFLSLLAPGVSITTSHTGGGFAIATGTSMAAPHVAGAWAIMKQADPAASVDTVLAALRASGVPVRDPRNDVTTPAIRIFRALGQVDDPDLAVTLVTGPLTVAPGLRVSVTTAVRNLTAGVAGAFRIDVFLTPELGAPGTGTLLGSRNVTGLAGRAESRAASLLTIPAGAAGGRFFFSARVDAGDAVAESDETNNTGPTTAPAIVTVLLPDLTMAALTAPSGAPGRPLAIASTVRNASPAPATAPAFRIDFYLSSDATLSLADDVFLGSRQVASLAGLGLSAAATTVLVPPGVAPGAWFVVAVADGGHAVTEASEGNNERATATPIQIALPDLAATLVGAPAVGVAGRALALTATVRNLAPAPGAAPGFQVRWFLTTGAPPGPGDTPIGQAT
ncbi:MAG TPA: S8 family serine peptidase, partial [Methylomirabilota bacterium]|nr:S8 family serine peptidase [Methylomirabilota bacterium]